MPSLRLLTWNCHHGALDACLADVSELSPDVAFVQEWMPSTSALLPAGVVGRQVRPRKGIALTAVNAAYTLTDIAIPAGAGQATIAARVTGPVSFTAIGLWAQTPKYVDDVLQSVTASAELIRSGPTVVMGDFNSGTNLGGTPALTRGHLRIVDGLGALGLVSAYHAFHKIDHGREPHATYRHQFKASQPWHLDFCFVPKAWAERISAVEVISRDKWDERSDHRPVQVDLHPLAPDRTRRITLSHAFRRDVRRRSHLAFCEDDARLAALVCDEAVESGSGGGVHGTRPAHFRRGPGRTVGRRDGV